MDVEGAEGGGVPAKRQLFVGGGGGDTAGESPPVVCCPLPLLNELPSGRVAQWDRALTAMGGRLVFDAARHKDVTHVLCRLPPGDWLPEALRPGAAPPGVRYVAVQWLRDSIGKACWLPADDYSPADVAAAEAQAAAAAAAAAELEGHPGRCVGSLLGVMIGDCLGRPFVYRSRREWSYVRSHHPDGLKDLPGDLRYTDDTQMTIALAKSLVQQGQCLAAAAAEASEGVGTGGSSGSSESSESSQGRGRLLLSSAGSQAYWRERDIWYAGGYARKTAEILDQLAAGKVACGSSGRLFWEEGSWANGAAMRIAPVGLAYRNAPPEVLREAVAAALLCTHVHPEAVDAATVQAAAVGLLAKSGVTEPALESPAALLQRLLPYSQHPGMRERLEAIAAALQRLPEGSDAADVRGSVWEGRPDDPQWELDCGLLAKVVEEHSSTHFYQIRAADAVASALWALCQHWGHPEAAIEGAIHYGGDTDTVGAITGALAGAQAGCSWVPGRWWEQLVHKIKHPESGTLALVALAQRLAELDVQD